MTAIRWGIIGCGNVTELKSGPAFQKVKNSSLVAVMRRDGIKAKDYAKRHGVPRWYDDARALIDDKEVNAIYIATPPLQHTLYTALAAEAGKPVYVEKPMTRNGSEAAEMISLIHRSSIKLSVAHYRRAQPYFIKIGELLSEGHIGKVQWIRLSLLQPRHSNMIATSDVNWRIDPKISGGGLFHDLAPHQLDILMHYFGKPKMVKGYANNLGGHYAADDFVSGQILFPENIMFNGIWSFSVPEENNEDQCEIVGTEGSITFSMFGNQEIYLRRQGKVQQFNFQPPEHVQQPMIESVVRYFMDEGPNPCSVEDGAIVMNMMDGLTASFEGVISEAYFN